MLVALGGTFMISWMRSLAPPWDCKELLWDLGERIRLAPEKVTNGNLGLD